MIYFKEHITPDEIICLITANKDIKQIGAIIGINGKKYHLTETMVNQFGIIIEAMLHRKNKLEETETINVNDKFLKMIIGPDVNVNDKTNNDIITDWFGRLKMHNHRILAVIY